MGLYFRNKLVVFTFISTQERNNRAMIAVFHSFSAIYITHNVYVLYKKKSSSVVSKSVLSWLSMCSNRTNIKCRLSQCGQGAELSHFLVFFPVLAEYVNRALNRNGNEDLPGSFVRRLKQIK